METATKDLSTKINGVTISYDDKGAGKIPLIFIHGFPFDRSTWQPQIDALKETNRVISYDIRGFGKSTADDGEIASMDLFASDLIAFMDALGIPKAIVCGFSMGGYILLNAVGKYPERFEAIILSDTQCIADSNEASDKRYETIKQIEEKGLDEFAENFIKNVFSKKTLEQKKELVEEVKSLILATSVRTITSALHAMAQRRESCSILKDIAIPALIICGSEDKLTPPEQAEFMHKHISGSQVHIIKNAGHLSNLEQPEEFTAHIHNFLPGFLS